jgi:outer membrane protein TolC
MAAKTPAARAARHAVAGVAVLGLAGCATTAVQENLDATREFAQREAGIAVEMHTSEATRKAAEQRVRTLLAEPLTKDGAVEIALRHSPAFQQLLADSAAASAAAVQSGRLPNPIVDFERLTVDGGLAIERILSISLLDFVLWPQRQRLAELQQVQNRLRSAGDVITTAVEARQAWIDAVAAEQSVRYASQVQQAAAAGAELGRQMGASGNFSRLERARQQAFYADATAELARARLDAVSAREALVRQLGLGGELAAALQLPEWLPDLPPAPDAEDVLTRRAFEDRLDVQLARAELDFTARSLGLTRVTSTVNALEVGRVYNTAPGDEVEKGFAVEFRLPLFDFGDARRANASAVYLAAFNRTAQVAVDAGSHVRESYAAYRTAYDLARHYRDEIVPLRKSIADENLLLYNGMLISVFELLADAREQANSVRQAIDAQRAFWTADAALRATLVGRPIEGISLGLPVVAPGAGAAQPH